MLSIHACPAKSNFSTLCRLSPDVPCVHVSTADLSSLERSPRLIEKSGIVQTHKQTIFKPLHIISMLYICYIGSCSNLAGKNQFSHMSTPQRLKASSPFSKEPTNWFPMLRTLGDVWASKATPPRRCRRLGDWQDGDDVWLLTFSTWPRFKSQNTWRSFLHRFQTRISKERQRQHCVIIPVVQESPMTYWANQTCSVLKVLGDPFYS